MRPLGRFLLVFAVSTATIVGGGFASATGASVAVTYTIVETREITILASSGDPMVGSVIWVGEGARLTVEVSGSTYAPRPAMDPDAGASSSDLRPGDLVTAAEAGPFPYRLAPSAIGSTVTFTVSAA